MEENYDDETPRSRRRRGSSSAKAISFYCGLAHRVISTPHAAEVTPHQFLTCYRAFDDSYHLFSNWKSILLNSLKEEEPVIPNILDFIQLWMKECCFDWNDDMLNELNDVIEKKMSQLKRESVRGIKKAIKETRNGINELKTAREQNECSRKRHDHSEVNNIAKSLRTSLDMIEFANASDKVRVTNLKASSVAKVFTAHEWQIYMSLISIELVDQNWQKRKELAPNMLRLINRFNEVSYWTATQVVSAKEPKAQAQVIEAYIKIAQELDKLNNFNSLAEIMAGLNNSAVRRLRKPWSMLSEKRRSEFGRLNELAKGVDNYKKYRNELKQRTGPILPYFAVDLRDISLFNIKSPIVDKGKDLNLEHYEITVLIDAALQFQQKPYKGSSDSSLEKQLVHTPLLRFSDEILHSLSLESEPAIDSPRMKAVKEEMLMEEQKLNRERRLSEGAAPEHFLPFDLDVPALTFNKEKQVLYANQRALRIFELELGGVIGKDLSVILPDFEMPELEAGVTHTFEPISVSGKKRDGRIALKMSLEEQDINCKNYFSAIFEEE